jgi:hypothetical protein
MLAIGQWYDLEKKGSLLELAACKTGVLFELVTETVALCVGMDTGFWRQWGRSLGILFQWMDDWQDREEDAAQGTRNAFLEAYEETLVQYRVLWRKVEAGIGPSWFLRPFGAFMKGYFTGGIPAVCDIVGAPGGPLAERLTTETVVVFDPLVLPDQLGDSVIRNSGMTGTEMVRLLLRHSHEFFTLPSLRTYLWELDEKDWEHAPDVRELLTRAPIRPHVLFE